MQIDYGFSSRSRVAEDRLNQIFVLREKFMEAIRDKRGAYSEWPCDISD